MDLTRPISQRSNPHNQKDSGRSIRTKNLSAILLFVCRFLKSIRLNPSGKDETDSPGIPNSTGNSDHLQCYLQNEDFGGSGQTDFES